MKRILIIVCLCLSSTVGLWAQTGNKSNPQLFTGAAGQEGPGPAGSSIHIQVGNGVHYESDNAGYSGGSISTRFPWDVLYIPKTFAEAYFEVSKGYFSEYIQIDWTLQNNANNITRIVVYRRPFTGNYTDDIQDYVTIATLAKDAYTYRDINVQGGKLYEYKVAIEGFPGVEEKYTTYITGVGYRSPTGVVTGNVTFNSGSPVRDVVLRADPQGAERNVGSSLQLSGNGQLYFHTVNAAVNDNATLQAWVKLQVDATATTRDLFYIDNTNQPNNSVKVSYTLTDANGLEIDITQPGGNQMKFNVRDNYPTGEVDGRGYDAMASFDTFDEHFVHVSVGLSAGQIPKLYLNGRPITSDYVDGLPADIPAADRPSITVDNSFSYTAVASTDITMADGLSGFIDEIRIWNVDLPEARIRTDFKRYLGGTETGLAAYLRCDEQAGDHVFDISRVGFDFNKNHALITNGTWSQERPEPRQLGILGVTDESGNYIISAIPYLGVGESYTITPMLGVHQFEPAQQLVYIGNGSEVVNQVKFTDISSFRFLGTVYYTTDGVFANAGEVDNVTQVVEAGYNQYRAQINGNEQLVSKGEHVLDNGTLYYTPKVFVEGANVYVDGNIVLDRDKRPVVTGPDGKFDIQVPIGNHFIEVKKDKHHFMHAGRFPAARADGDDLFEFFEHQQTSVTFLDTTRVQLVGRVVGGSREASKPIGFGFNGPHTYAFPIVGAPDSLVTLSSSNNIGVAALTLTYLPFGGTPGIGELKYKFETHPLTGEYKVNVLPLSYTLDQVDGVRIKNNSAIQLLTANEILNLSNVPDTLRSIYKDGAGKELEKSEPYHFEKRFTYRNAPTLNTRRQTSDESVKMKVIANGAIREETISTDGLATADGDEYLIYTQYGHYLVEFETYEEYVNNDGDEPVLYRDPVTDGEFIINNNLAIPSTEMLETSRENPSIKTYRFQAGLPAISPPFTRNISIKYRVNGVDYNAVNYNPEGIILGGAADGSQTFVTVAPQMPDIILRDPPGSNSSASIEAGETISFTSDFGYSHTEGGGTEEELKLGVTVTSVNAPLGIGTITEGGSKLDINLGVKVTARSADGKSLAKTYEFTKKISTSDNPQYVGADGDLYIGQSSNYFYGTFNSVQADKDPIGDNESMIMTNAAGKSLHISTQKGFFFSEQPTGTAFAYSQKFLLTTLIPELESIITGLENGTIPTSGPGAPPLQLDQYKEQVRQWKKVIYENEKTKYQAINQKTVVKTGLQQVVDNYANTLTTELEQSLLSGPQKDALEGFLNQASEVKTLLDDKFSENISFDAGVGEVTNSLQTSSVIGNTKSFNITVDESFSISKGFSFNKVGLSAKQSQYHTSEITGGLSKQSAVTTTISYTLKDNDLNNYFSVDVVNAFDGNGPVFSTLGGRTSCPYEGAELTEFYSSRFNNDSLLYHLPVDLDAANNPLTDKRETLSKATQQIQKPEISVAVADVVDVPEARAAEFKLILENNNPAGVDGLSSYFDLWVDNSTNQQNAIFNIGANGTNVYVPYGKQTEFNLTLRKSLSDVYEYKNIDIYLMAPCESSIVYDLTTISATFRPSCTAVQITQPLDNWVVNAVGAFNPDNTTNALPVQVSGYDRAFTSFQRFDLQYRKSTSSTWTNLDTYYNSQELLDAAMLEGKSGEVINGTTATYPWDIGGMGLSDGKYELRAISYCSNGTQFISDVVTGTVDLNIPKPFGTPSPADGILGPGKDITMKFNEAILYSSALSRIQIKGETNQQKINHNVSVHFEGAANTMTVTKPNIVGGDFSIEFWMQNQTTGTATVMSQPDALRVTLNNGVLAWTLGTHTVQGVIAGDGLFHHYTLTYNDDTHEMRIYQDDSEVSHLSNAAGLTVVSDNPLTIGGNTFVGNLHDLRLWAKSLSLADAYAAQYNELMGTERNLVGYWPMNEGHGAMAKDLARYKHATMNAQWDIKPRGTAYEFANGQYLELDDVNFVQLTRDMDVTLSFWIKTSQQGTATIFSNGRGNGEDLIQSNGLANKWSVDMQAGTLYLRSEGQSYKLTSAAINDDTWHHVAIVLRRLGTLRTFVDAAPVSSYTGTQIGGLSGNRFWIGARGLTNASNEITIDQEFTGKIDELRLWKLARATEQIDRDRYNEIDFNSLGLMLYARMNEPNPPMATGPAYYHAAANETVLSSAANLSAGTVTYTTDAPGIRPVREYLNFNVTHVINNDEIVLTPDVTDWSVLEGQIIDITVAGMYDVYGNQQSSPVTWSAYVRRNEVAWYVTEGGLQNLSLEKQVGEKRSFGVTLQNKGGRIQPYTINGIPAWLNAKATSGSLQPNSTNTLTFEIAPELSIGEYTIDLLLDTDFNFDEKITVNLRVLGEAPDWTINPAEYEYSMSIIGKIIITGNFSSDPYTRIAAFAGEEIRGVASLEYDVNYDEHFVYLNIFSNTSSGEEITFKIWDAANGKIYQATMNGDLTYEFMQNEVVGIKSAPVIFENTSYIEQNIALNAGWTWVSFYAEDENLGNLNALTSSLNLNDNDLIKGQLHFDVFDHGTGWDGTLSSNGGLQTSSMYKIRLAQANTLFVGGDETDVNTWTADVRTGWNWLAYPLTTNLSINDALAFLDAAEGDVIKNQRSFAIYDPLVGWSGTLHYLFAGEGYMLKAGISQNFRYPNIFKSARNARRGKDTQPAIDGWQTYEHNMNVIAEVMSAETYDSVFVTDMRGIIRGKAAVHEENGRRLGYITVFGKSQDDETLYFSLSNTELTVPTNRSFSFTPDVIMGTFREPVKLTPATDGEMTVYPNAFSGEINVRFYARDEQETEIILIDNAGRTANATPVQVAKGYNLIQIQPDVPSGFYLLTVVVDGQKRTFKIVKISE